MIKRLPCIFHCIGFNSRLCDGVSGRCSLLSSVKCYHFCSQCWECPSLYQVIKICPFNPLKQFVILIISADCWPRPRWETYSELKLFTRSWEKGRAYQAACRWSNIYEFCAGKCTAISSPWHVLLKSEKSKNLSIFFIECLKDNTWQQLYLFLLTLKIKLTLFKLISDCIRRSNRALGHQSWTSGNVRWWWVENLFDLSNLPILYYLLTLWVFLKILKLRWWNSQPWKISYFW